jgi:hypothetical protein
VEVFGVTVADADVPPNQRTNEVAPTVAGDLLRVGRIYLESAVRDYARGREILERFPGAELVGVPSHWNIPELHDEAGLREWNRTKKNLHGRA